MELLKLGGGGSVGEDINGNKADCFGFEGSYKYGYDMYIKSEYAQKKQILKWFRSIHAR
ncbi:MAG: hypothetical protein MZV70_69835 [Desulfobacterales bacterium]|nr:hypothetical protein [Desulfobacterales bacterium]